MPVPSQVMSLSPGGGQALPMAVRQQMESALDASFADVRVHVGPEASRIGAIAFTTGSDIYFAHGQYNPSTPQGQALLGHELVHVIQQRAGRVRSPYSGGLAVVQDAALEAEADRLGARASRHAVAPVVQRKPRTIQAASRSGVCQDSNSLPCATGYRTGLCPGPANIKCCPDGSSIGHNTRGSGSRSGVCQDSNVMACATGYLTGLCPGPANIKFCPSGTAIGDDLALEYEADTMGARAAQLKTAPGFPPRLRTASGCKCAGAKRGGCGCGCGSRHAGHARH